MQTKLFSTQQILSNQERSHFLGVGGGGTTEKFFDRPTFLNLGMQRSAIESISWKIYIKMEPDLCMGKVAEFLVPLVPCTSNFSGVAYIVSPNYYGGPARVFTYTLIVT